MHWRKKLLHRSSVYLILDASVNTYPELLSIVKSALACGIGIIQLRDKKGSARDIIAFSRKVLQLTKGRILYIINDRVDLCLAVKADGVHVGQDDLPILMARKILGPKLLIGTSAQNKKHLKRAHEDRVDYLGFGSVFQTLTKPEREAMDQRLLSYVYRQAKLPVFAIGGITLKQSALLKDLGVNRVAVCREVCQAVAPKKVITQFVKDFSLSFLRG